MTAWPYNVDIVGFDVINGLAAQLQGVATTLIMYRHLIPLFEGLEIIKPVPTIQQELTNIDDVMLTLKEQDADMFSGTCTSRATKNDVQ